ncbi:hypothetical protein [Agrococcus sp. Marseille-P2731]|uniref:hypothetical protein n=1 Tax=Agrococcus sp. Marseille-P2731 TaxID=1841862 RepID=UPI000931C09C|nr:hypothetical protein [Agrococcus sp. Marseille-P2731]
MTVGDPLPGSSEQATRLRELLDDLARYPTGTLAADPDPAELALCAEIQAIVHARRRARAAGQDSELRPGDPA